MAKLKGREYSYFSMNDVYDYGCKIYVNDEKEPRKVEDVSAGTVYFEGGEKLKKRGNEFYRCIALPFKVGDHGYYNGKFCKIISINVKKGYYEYTEESGQEWRADIDRLDPKDWEKSDKTFLDRREKEDMRIAQLFREGMLDSINGMMATFRIDPSFKE